MPINIPPDIQAAAYTITGAAAKEVVERQVGKVAKKLDNLNSKATEAFDIQSREVTIMCPESIQKYSLLLTAKEAGILNRSAKFEFGRPRRVSLKSLIGFNQPAGALSETDQGFHINLSKLRAGEQYLLDVEYLLDDPSFIDLLVNRLHPKETGSQQDVDFWMVAQLKHVEALKKKYDRLELRDIDFNVDVGVHQDIETKIPNTFKEQLDTIRKLVGPLGRDETFSTYYKLRAMKSQRYGTKAPEILGKILDLFSPVKFRQFVLPTGDFTYAGCEKGLSLYDFPVNVWPKFMTITSRTDLNLEKEAATGSLRYHKAEFLDSIEKIFS